MNVTHVGVTDEILQVRIQSVSADEEACTVAYFGEVQSDGPVVAISRAEFPIPSIAPHSNFCAGIRIGGQASRCEGTVPLEGQSSPSGAAVGANQVLVDQPFRPLSSPSARRRILPQTASRRSPSHGNEQSAHKTAESSVHPVNSFVGRARQHHRTPNATRTR